MGSKRGKQEDLEASAVILAGGRSLRLGYNKVLEVVGNKSLLEGVISCVASLSSEVIVVATEDQVIPQFQDYPDLQVVTDIYPGKGPLGGIYTGLKTSTSPCNLVVAADMPFLNRALLEYMLELVNGFDLVVPRLGGRVEPLHSVYVRGCLAAIEKMVKEGELRINKLFPRVNVRYVEASEIERFDPEQRSFFNINTEGDLRLARELIGRSRDND
jgi:molybdopterin-guanine dinucleotide biosynthesis protein A